MKDSVVGMDEARGLVAGIRAQMGPIADKFAAVWA